MFHIGSHSDKALWLESWPKCDRKITGTTWFNERRRAHSERFEHKEILTDHNSIACTMREY